MSITATRLSITDIVYKNIQIKILTNTLHTLILSTLKPLLLGNTDTAIENKHQQLKRFYVAVMK